MSPINEESHMTDRYGREIAVGDIALAKLLNHPDRKYVVGTIQSIDEDKKIGGIACLSIVPRFQVDLYDFDLVETELIIKQDGTLAMAMTTLP
jgi:hypothetical protein